MAGFIQPLERLIESFRRLPGIGYKTAVRLAFHVIDMPAGDAEAFAAAIMNAKREIKLCSVCQNISQTDVCDICSSDSRDKSTICVTENSKDVAAIEKIRDYNGLYHVLGGLISPINGVTPDKLKIKELLSRLNDDTVKEIIIATNPNIEGEATAMYISKLIKPLGIKVTRLAYGIPAGGELEFTDEVTLSRAIEGRREL
ncbi:MAG: recombination protein RecR [Ruminococcaceae bacterium]|nr:recombination protein RecR [Oscillospiraceae bacterium]